jgi:aspartyl-tRNA(Asn)/glutamyl-tRNA(Gln) amidotransferase subunit C
MRDTITKEIFDHLVQLAAFELDAAEAEYLRRELNDQLNAVRELETIQIPEHVPITSHGVPYTSEIRAPLRADVVKPCPEADDIVDGAPEVEDRYIVVPDIPREQIS